MDSPRSAGRNNSRRETTIGSVSDSASATRRSLPKDHAVARRTDPTTSHEAAKSLDDLTGLRAEVYELLRELGRATDEELRDAYQRKHPEKKTPAYSTLATRRNELEHDYGVVQPVIVDGKQLTKPNRRGNQCLVWQIKDDTQATTQEQILFQES